MCGFGIHGKIESVLDCHGSGVTIMLTASHNFQTEKNVSQLVDQLNGQICELESLMQRLHFSLSELRLVHPNTSGIPSDAALHSSDAASRALLEFQPARTSLC